MIDALIDYLISQRNFSPHTARCYKFDLGQFETFLAGSTNKTTLIEAQPEDIRRFLADLKREQCKTNTVARQMAALRCFYGFCVKHGRLQHNPMEGFVSPQRDGRLPAYLSEEQIQQVLQAPDTSTLNGVRCRAILGLLYATGIRVGELTRLNLADVDFDEELIVTRDRRGFPRSVPVAPTALAWVRTYMGLRTRDCGRRKSDHKALFLNTRGRRMGDRSVRQEIDSCLAKASIDYSVNPSILRGSYAIHMLNHGVNLRDLQELLGQRSIVQTDIRAELNKCKDYKKEYKQALAMNDEHPEELETRHPKTEAEAKDDVIDLFSLGVLVQVKIKHWSMRAMLTPDDYRKMGLNPDKLPPDLTNLGRKLLVPKEESKAFERIESLTRFHLKEWSVPFGMGYASFVPAAKIGKVESEFTRLRDEFNEKLDSFISRLDQMKKVMRETNQKFWDLCLKRVYPTNAEDVRDRFAFEWFFFKVSGVNTKPIKASKIEKQEQARVIRAEEMRRQIQKQAQDFVAEYVAAMREEIVKFCELATCRINGDPYGDEKDTKQLTARTIAGWKTYVDHFREMNIFGDDELERMLNDFYKEYVEGKTLSDFKWGSGSPKKVTECLSRIRLAASMEGEKTSQFINRIKRKVVI